MTLPTASRPDYAHWMDLRDELMDELIALADHASSSSVRDDFRLRANKVLARLLGPCPPEPAPHIRLSDTLHVGATNGVGVWVRRGGNTCMNLSAMEEEKMAEALGECARWLRGRFRSEG